MTSLFQHIFSILAHSVDIRKKKKPFPPTTCNDFPTQQDRGLSMEQPLTKMNLRNGNFLQSHYEHLLLGNYLLEQEMISNQNSVQNF